MTMTMTSRTGGSTRAVAHKPFDNTRKAKSYRDAVSPPPENICNTLPARVAVASTATPTQNAAPVRSVRNTTSNVMGNTTPRETQTEPITITQKPSTGDDFGRDLFASPRHFVSSPRWTVSAPPEPTLAPNPTRGAIENPAATISNVEPARGTVQKAWPLGHLHALEAAPSAIDQSTAIGWEVSQEEWDRRKGLNHCQWCNSTEHNRCNHCIWWWLDHKEEQMIAVGRAVRAVERRRRVKCRFCVWCASPKHQQNDCLKAARAQAQEAMDRLGDSHKTQAAAKAVRKAAWEEKQKVEKEKEKEKNEKLEMEQNQNQKPVKKPNFRGRRRHGKGGVAK